MTEDGNIIERFDLYNQKDGSDKIYRGRLVQVDGGYLVNYIHHARLKTPKHGSKSKTGPVGEKEARKIYDSLLTEKLSSGYQAIEGSDTDAPAFQKIGAKRMVGYAVQLPTEMNKDELDRYLTDDSYMAQVKEEDQSIDL